MLATAKSPMKSREDKVRADMEIMEDAIDKREETVQVETGKKSGISATQLMQLSLQISWLSLNEPLIEHSEPHPQEM